MTQESCPLAAAGHGVIGVDCATAVLAGIILVHIAPIWLFPFFPSQDGPAHLYNAAVLAEYPWHDTPQYRAYYLLNPRTVPNWLGHVILAPLVRIVGPTLAERLLLSSCVIGLPLAMRYALRAVRHEAEWLWPLALPFAFNLMFHKGFWNFALSLPLFLVVLGFVVRRQERFTARAGLGLAALLLLMYGAHIVTLVLAWIAVVALTGWWVVRDMTTGGTDRRGFATVLATRALWPAVGLLPSMLVTAGFLAGREANAQDFLATTSFMGRLAWLLQLESLVSFSAVERVGGIATTILFALCAAYVLTGRVYRPQVRRGDGLAVVVCLFLVAHFTAPDAMFGGTFLVARIALFPFLVAVLWFGTHDFHVPVRRVVALAAVAVSLVTIALRLPRYASVNEELATYVSAAPHIEPHATLLGLPFSPADRLAATARWPGRVAALRHASGILGTARQLVILDNYEAMSNLFPLRYRPERNPYRHIGLDSTSGLPQPTADLLGYGERTRGEVDYVVIWGLEESQRAHPATRNVMRQLAAGYELVYMTPRDAPQLRLYRRLGYPTGTGNRAR